MKKMKPGKSSNENVMEFDSETDEKSLKSRKSKVKGKLHRRKQIAYYFQFLDEKK